MKKRITALLAAVLICLVFSVSVVAAYPEYSVDIPDDFTVGYAEKDMGNIAKIIGTPKDELKKQCEESGILFIAVNKDNTVQVRLSKYETELSKKAANISAMSEETLKKLSENMSDNGYEKTAINKTVFLKTEDNLTDSGGNYVSKQYITVKNGFVYHLSVYVSENAENEAAQNPVNSLKFNEKPVYSAKQKIIIAVVIAVLLVLIGIMIAGVVKDIKSKDEEDSN